MVRHQPALEPWFAAATVQAISSINNWWVRRDCRDRRAELEYAIASLKKLDANETTPACQSSGISDLQKLIPVSSNSEDTTSRPKCGVVVRTNV